MKKLIIALISSLAIISCDTTTCKNTNSIFDTNAPESKTYQDELVKQLQKRTKKNLTYTLENYVEKGGENYLYLGVSDETLCAIAVLKVTTSDTKLDPIHKTKGQGYFGAVFQNLQFQIVQDSIKTELIYESVDQIID